MYHLSYSVLFKNILVWVSKMHRQEKILRVVCSVFVAAASFALSSFFVDISTWYKTLRKPQLMPSDTVFVAAWILLYAFLNISSAILLVKDKQKYNAILKPYLFIAVLNPLWTFTFFYRQNVFGALYVLIILVFVTLQLLQKTYKANIYSAYFILPFIIWINFCLYLNYELVFLN